MSEKLVLAIDQGTTNTKVVLVDGEGRVRGRASRPVSLAYPQPAWVEIDPDELWRSVADATDECLARGGDPSLAAIGISNQRESVLLWERKTGRPLGPVVIWQCRRTARLCEDLRARGLEPFLRGRTGLTIDPLFSATKLRWLLDQVPDAAARAARGELAAGTVDAWILWNLTGGAVHATDASNAARTQLASLESGGWDLELLALFQVPPEVLPRIGASSEIFGTTVPRGRLPGGVPVAALAGDSHAALFGHGAPGPGVVKATYGTGSSLMSPTEGIVRSARGIASTVAWRLGGRTTYALEGNIAVTGAAVQWVAELLRLGDAGGDGAERVAVLAREVPSSDGVYLVPAFVGLGAPWWDADARGTITGLSRGSGAAHLARAAVESIAYQVRDVFEVLAAEAGRPLDALLADGGASRNDALMQFQADVLGRPVLRARSADLSALGAAFLAGLAVGVWSDLAHVAGLPRERERFEPRLPAGERERLCAGWLAAVARSRSGSTSFGPSSSV